MCIGRRPMGFWAMIAFLVASLFFLLAGQTTAVFDYDLAVGLGFQEREELVSRFGVEVNRAFGAGDSIVYVPLIVASLVGLFLRKDWSLSTTAAVMGISIYWATTSVFMLLFLKGVPAYRFTPGPEYWLITGAYIVLGTGGILYLIFRGKQMIR